MDTILTHWTDNEQHQYPVPVRGTAATAHVLATLCEAAPQRVAERLGAEMAGWAMGRQGETERGEVAA